MNSRIWVNVGLLVFIVLLSATVFFSDTKTEPEIVFLSNIDRKEITNIQVIRKNLDDFVFNKQGEDWYMHAPLKVLANNARINAMLRILKARSYGQLNPKDIDLKRFELDDPKITIKLNEHVFQFGNTDAIDQRRYILFNDTIYITNDSLYAQLTTNAAFFADLKLLPADIEITSITFPENKIEKVTGQWQLQTQMNINPEQLKRIAFSWQEAAAISASKYTTQNNQPTITIASSNHVSIKFNIVSTEPNIVLGRKDLGIQYHLGSDEADKLLLKEETAPTNTSETTAAE